MSNKTSFEDQQGLHIKNPQAIEQLIDENYGIKDFPKFLEFLKSFFTKREGKNEIIASGVQFSGLNLRTIVEAIVANLRNTASYQLTFGSLTINNKNSVIRGASQFGGFNLFSRNKNSPLSDIKIPRDTAVQIYLSILNHKDVIELVKNFFKDKNITDETIIRIADILSSTNALDKENIDNTVSKINKIQKQLGINCTIDKQTIFDIFPKFISQKLTVYNFLRFLQWTVFEDLAPHEVDISEYFVNCIQSIIQNYTSLSDEVKDRVKVAKINTLIGNKEKICTIEQLVNLTTEGKEYTIIRPTADTYYETIPLYQLLFTVYPITLIEGFQDGNKFGLDTNYSKTSEAVRAFLLENGVTTQFYRQIPYDEAISDTVFHDLIKYIMNIGFSKFIDKFKESRTPKDENEMNNLYSTYLDVYKFIFRILLEINPNRTDIQNDISQNSPFYQLLQNTER